MQSPMISKAKLLIAEDDRALGSLIQRALVLDGHSVVLVADGDAAVLALHQQLPDLAILDLNLPKQDGLAVLRELRQLSETTPALILTGASELDSRLQCFLHGADDCMLKPFALRELRARCAVLLRRRVGKETMLRCADLEVNRLDRSVRRGGLSITLTTKEYELLECLMLSKGRCVSRDVLMHDVWKLEAAMGNTNVVDVYINYLRRKLKTDPADPLIATVRGEGYRIGEPVQTAL